MVKLRPLSNNLLIRRAGADDRSAGGIYLPDKAQKKPHRGTVVAAGPGYVDHGVFVATECAPGDIVLFGEAMGVEVDVVGETLLVMSEDAVLAVVEK